MDAFQVVAAAQEQWLPALVNSAFDPEWNVEHRTTIWVSVLVVLFLSGVGLPLPEDIPLTITGFTTFKQCGDRFSLPPFALAFALVTTAILSGDLVAYWMGKTFGFGIRNRFKFLRRALTDARIAKVQRWFDRYGSFTVFLGRQVAGVRFVTFFTAGTMRVPLWKFVLFDFLGCLVSVPVWMTLGALASRYGAPWLHRAASWAGSGFVVGAIAVFLLFLLIIKLRDRRECAS